MPGIRALERFPVSVRSIGPSVASATLRGTMLGALAAAGDTLRR